jgi:hypothetical protein
MADRGFYKNTKSNVVRIFRFLKQCEEEDRGHVTVGEISRGVGLHKWIVSRTIDLRMQHFLDIIIPERLEDVGLRIKLVKLKEPGLTEAQVLRSLTVKI